MVGPDPTDLYSLPMPDTSWTRSLADLHPPRRIGWSPTLGYATVDREMLAVCEGAVAALEERGTEVVEIETVFDEDPGLDWMAMTSTYNLRSLGHLRDTPMWSKLDPGVVAMMDWARDNVSAVDLAQAQDACHRANLRLVELFHQVPLLLTPTVAGQPGPIGGQGNVNGEESPNWVAFTYPFNMTRSPAGTVCAGFTDDGMPIGLQVIGPQHADVAVLRLLALHRGQPRARSDRAHVESSVPSTRDDGRIAQLVRAHASHA